MTQRKLAGILPMFAVALQDVAFQKIRNGRVWLMKLSGKVALVTGGSRGIGAATALRLAEEGADVAITYARAAGAAEEIVKKITGMGRRALAIQADSADAKVVAGLPARVAKDLGRLDIIVNNAGTFTAAPLDSVTLDEFRKEMAVNVEAALVLAKAAFGILPQGGRFITVGSVLGQRVPFTNMAVYSTSKFALQGLTRALSRDFAPHGVLVNCVQPGPVKTDMNPGEGEFAEVLRNMTALRRFGLPHEIAGAIAFLAGPDAAYITGTALNVDGGMEA
jgi:NAD(P)-dependent dehydrogenase (short-subunit alcohol dehydrogenase family)